MSDQVAAVVREHAPFVWRALCHLGVPERQVADASQEVFVAVFRNLHRFEGRSSMKTWLFGICRNIAARHARSRARAREALAPGPLPEMAVAESQSRELARREVSSRLEHALQKLPEGTRMVFVLYEIESLPMAEVAAAVGCNESTAYSRLYVARDSVRKQLLRVGLLTPGQALEEVLP